MLQVLRTLLDAKAQADRSDNNSVTALIWAAQNGHYEVIDMLAKAAPQKINHHANNGAPIERFSIRIQHTSVSSHLERISTQCSPEFTFGTAVSLHTAVLTCTLGLQGVRH